MKKEYIVSIDFGYERTKAWIVSLDLYTNETMGEPLKLRRCDKWECWYYSAIYFTPNNGYSLDDISDDVIVGFRDKVSVLNQQKKEAYRAYIQAIYNRILELNTQLKVGNNGEANFYLCIACPTKWNQKEKDDYIKFFNSALEKYEIEVMWVINESDAAYFSHGSIDDYKDKCVLIIDYGSSTIDYTVVFQGKKISDDNWSNRLGASNIESAILKNYRDNDEDFQLKYQNTKSKLEEVGSGFIDIYSNLLFVIRKAKELSVTQGYYPNLSVNYNLIGEKTDYGSSDEFKKSEKKKYKFEIECQIDEIEAFKKYYEKVVDDFNELNKKIQQKIGNKEIELVILNGGACQMPWVREVVKDIFSPLKICIDSQASFSVAKGVALYAKTQIKTLHIKANTNTAAKAFKTMKIRNNL